MKHQTPESMKFKRLQRRLGCSRVTLVGTLELLWIATQNNAKRGDIGKYSNEDIAICCEWEGDPDEFVASLVATGWLDDCPQHRLIVHDWKQHAPRYIHAWVKSQGTSFAEPTGGTTEATTVATTEPTVVPTTEGGIPNQTKPNQTKEETPTESLSAEPTEETQQQFLAVWNSAKGIRECRVLSTKRKTSLRNRSSERVAVTAKLSMRWLDALEVASREKFPLPCTRGSPGSWVPDADWILRPDSLPAIFEGKYDWTKDDRSKRQADNSTIAESSGERGL